MSSILLTLTKLIGTVINSYRTFDYYFHDDFSNYFKRHGVNILKINDHEVRKLRNRLSEKIKIYEQRIGYLNISLKYWDWRKELVADTLKSSPRLLIIEANIEQMVQQRNSEISVVADSIQQVKFLNLYSIVLKIKRELEEKRLFRINTKQLKTELETTRIEPTKKRDDLDRAINLLEKSVGSMENFKRRYST